MQTKIEKKRSSKTRVTYERGCELLARIKIHASGERMVDIIDEARAYFDLAVKYDFNDLAAEFADFLYYYFCNNVGNMTRAEKYWDYSEKYNELVFIERKVRKQFARFSYHLNKTKSLSDEIKQELADYCEEIKPLIALDSASINVWIYSLLIPNAYLDRNYAEAFQLSKEIIQKLEERNIERTATFYKSACIASIVSGDYSNADLYIKKALDSITVGRGSWATFLYYQVVVHLYQGQYEKAFEYYEKSNNTTIINRMLKEQWVILRGYFRFLSQAKLIPGQHSFRLGYLFNSTPIFDKDKGGNNINISILKMLLTEPGKLIDSTDAIRKYAFRYLKGNHLRRAKHLMLFLINHANYRKSAASIKRYALPHLEELKATPITTQNIDIEIIPFDKIAEIVLTK